MTESVSPAAHPATPTNPASNPAAQTLEDRYNSGQRRSFDRRFAWGAGIVLVLATLGFFLFSGWQNTQQVTLQNIGFTSLGDGAVEIKFEVTSYPEARVACAVEALNTSKAVVGWNVLEIPVSEERIHTVTTDLVTTGATTAAHAKSCWIVTS